MDTSYARKQAKGSTCEGGQKLLKMYPNLDKKIVNIVTGDETWVKFLNPKGKYIISYARRLVIAKMTISVKKAMLAVCFDINGPIIQISIPRGRTVTVTFYKRRILGKLTKCFEKRRPQKRAEGHSFTS